jgi:hypothetical protein
MLSAPIKCEPYLITRRVYFYTLKDDDLLYSSTYLLRTTIIKFTLFKPSPSALVSLLSFVYIYIRNVCLCVLN